MEIFGMLVVLSAIVASLFTVGCKLFRGTMRVHRRVEERSDSVEKVTETYMEFTVERLTSQLPASLHDMADEIGRDMREGLVDPVRDPVDWIGLNSRSLWAVQVRDVVSVIVDWLARLVRRPRVHELRGSVRGQTKLTVTGTVISPPSIRSAEEFAMSIGNTLDAAQAVLLQAEARKRANVAAQIAAAQGSGMPFPLCPRPEEGETETP